VVSYTDKRVDFEGHVKRIWNSISDCCIDSMTDTYFYNVIIHNHLAVPLNCIFENIFFHTEEYTCIYANRGLELKNSYLRGTGFLAYLYSITENVNLIDCDSITWTFGWGGNSTGKVNRQNTFKLKSVDKEGSPIQGAAVEITDVYGQVVYSGNTWINGSIPTQTLTKCFYNQTGGDTPYLLEPYNLTISALGFLPYSNLFNISEPLSLVVALTLQEDGIVIQNIFDIPLIMFVGLATVFTGIGMLSKDSDKAGTGSVLGMLFWGACWGYWIIQHSTSNLGYFAWVFVAPFFICVFNAWDAVFKEADKGFGKNW